MFIDETMCKSDGKMNLHLLQHIFEIQNDVTLAVSSVGKRLPQGNAKKKKR